MEITAGTGESLTNTVLAWSPGPALVILLHG